MPHHSFCLLRNLRLALILTGVFVAGSTIYLLELISVIRAPQNEPFSLFYLGATAVVLLIVMKASDCLPERIIVLLFLFEIACKFLSGVEPQLLYGKFTEYQRVVAIFTFLSCAVISGFSAFKAYKRDNVADGSS